MENSFMVFILIIILVMFVLPCPIIILKTSKRLRDTFWWLVRNNGKILPYSTSKNFGMGKGIPYCPHPFTNWSLNPSYCNSLDEPQHTSEGFRKTQKEDSIKLMIKNNPDAYKIVCIGGSTTYCYGIERYQDTWSSLLKRKLANKNVLIFNFGVPHWTTIQSFIRCMTWFPIIRPNLLIYYQAKNDLNCLSNAADDEKYVFPDYQNIMKQFSQALNFTFPRWLLFVPFFALLEIRKLKRLDFSCLYRTKPDLQRIAKFVNKDIISGILFRLEALLKISNTINCKVIYIPEIVRQGEYATVLYDQVYKRVPEVVNKYGNAILFDIRNLMSVTDELFADKMHFSENGSKFFADILGEKINKDIFNAVS